MEAQKDILEFLHQQPSGASVSEISLATGHTRATAAKYLEVMKLHGDVHFHTVGKAKVWRVNDQKKKILIAEDEAPIRRLIAVILGKEDYQLIEAANGEEALEQVSEHMPDLILLDIMMPKVDGIQACQELKRNALTKKIPIIMLTAKGEMTDKIHGVKAGADDYLTKPFEPSELRERVISFLEQDVQKNPITQLPSPEAIFPVVRKRKLATWKLQFAHLEEYKKRYGYSKMTELVRLSAQIVTHYVDRLGESKVIGQDRDHNFFLGMNENDGKHIVKEIQTEFKSVLPFLYKDDDASFNEGKNVMNVVRKNGETEEIPLVELHAQELRA